MHSAAPDWMGLDFGSETVLKEETVRQLDADEQHCVAAEW